MLSNISFEEVFGDIQERKRPVRKKIGKSDRLALFHYWYMPDVR